MQEGLIDRPEGAKKGAFYTQKHLSQLLEVQKWQRAGLSLARIKELLIDPLTGGQELPLPKKQPGEVEVWSRIHIGEGIELNIEPSKAGLSPEQVRELNKQIVALTKALKSKE